MDLTANIYTIEGLHKCLQDCNNAVIYGAGVYGKRLVDYLISNNDEEKLRGIVVTEKKESQCEYRGFLVQEAHSFFKKDMDALVIIATSLDYQSDIVKEVVRYTRNYRCIIPEVYKDICKKLDIKKQVTYQGIDFLCAGFCKCGTTSLYSTLKGIDEIYLSDFKESMFFDWYEKVVEPQKILIEKHFGNIKQGQLVGMIEPTFCTHANQILKFFGDKLKIIFLVRNPVDAVFSDFKMENREGMAGLELSYQKKNVYYEEMFDEFFERITNEEEILVWEYAHWIEQFEKYYASQNIKIVFFEELVQNSQKEISSILQFIGVQEAYMCEGLPHENKGDFVMEDLNGYQAAKVRNEWACQNPQLSLEEVRKRKYKESQQYTEINQNYDQSKKLYGVKMTKEQKRNVEAYFNTSVRELEALTGRDLSKLWF